MLIHCFVVHFPLYINIISIVIYIYTYVYIFIYIYILYLYIYILISIVIPNKWNTIHFWIPPCSYRWKPLGSSEVCGWSPWMIPLRVWRRKGATNGNMLNAMMDIWYIQYNIIYVYICIHICVQYAYIHIYIYIYTYMSTWTS